MSTVAVVSSRSLRDGGQQKSNIVTDGNAGASTRGSMREGGAGGGTLRSRLEQQPQQQQQTKVMTAEQLDALIDKTLRLSPEEFTENVTPNHVEHLCQSAISFLKLKPPLVEVQQPMALCGDVHGQFNDVKKIFTTVGFPPKRRYMFLGDMVDRGSRSLETIVLLLAYRLRYPYDFFLLRGNHESGSINRIYGFYMELGQRYAKHGPDTGDLLWNQFNQVFAWLPYAGLIANRILCMHGGISPSLYSIQQLRELRRPFFDPPVPSLELDLLWSDPAPDISGFKDNPRGVSYLFGADTVATVCKRLNIDLIVRAHQCVEYGAEFFADAYVLTLFSAPNYEEDGQNCGAVLKIDAKLRCSFRLFK